MAAREELDQFRSEVVRFIETELPDALKAVATIRSAFEEDPGESEHAGPEFKTAKAQWREALRNKGWLAPS